MDLLRSLASSLTGGWSSRTRRGGSERGMFESSAPTMAMMATMPPSLPLPALAPLSPSRSNSSITNSSNSRGSYQHHHQSPHRAAAQRPTARSSLDGTTTTTPHPLRRRPSFSASASTLGPLDAGLPPPPSAPLPPEQVERYWRLQRRLAATLLPEVVRLEALCAEIAAAAAAAAAAEAGASASAGAAGAGSSSSSSPPSSSSPSRFPGSSPSASPRAGQDPHAATRIAALRRRTLVPLLARLRALPVSEATDGGGGGEATTTSTTTSSPSSSSSSSSRPCPPSGSPPSASTTTIPTRADLAALRRAAAVLPRYLEQLRVATRGRPRAYDAEKFCAAAAA